MLGNFSRKITKLTKMYCSGIVTYQLKILVKYSTFCQLLTALLFITPWSGFQLSVVKPKPKVITLANQKGHTIQ